MDDRDRCYTAALRILNYRFNSAAELRRKLAAKEFDEETIEATVARLRDEKWIDDERFAEAFVRTRMRKRIGPLRIRRELMAAGVDDEIAAAALRRNADGEGERDAALSIARKRAARLDLDSAAERNKLTSYLLKQGYDAALVRDIVRGVILSRRSAAKDPED
jgi:regulatory protein